MKQSVCSIKGCFIFYSTAESLQLPYCNRYVVISSNIAMVNSCEQGFQRRYNTIHLKEKPWKRIKYNAFEEVNVWWKSHNTHKRTNTQIIMYGYLPTCIACKHTLYYIHAVILECYLKMAVLIFIHTHIYTYLPTDACMYTHILVYTGQDFCLDVFKVITL